MRMRIVIIATLFVVAAAAPAGAKTESTPDGIRFTYTNPNAQTVTLAGDFNGWNATANPMTRDGDAYTTTIKLSPGDHEYKFVVDGQYFADPDNPTTSGSFGNSLVRIGGKGEILAMEATSNTALSPKILVGGRYIGLFVGRRDDGNQDRFAVRRPDFNIDLNFDVRVSEALDARVLTKIRNASEGTPLWETSLRFDRGHLDLHRSAFAVRVFDNDGIGTWSDPLQLVGNIGPYAHDFGFDQQGVRAIAGWRGITGTFFYADNFDAGDPLPPALDPRPVENPGLRYDVNLNANNENTMGLRLERALRRRLHAGVSLRNDRGYNPGSLSQVQVVDDSTRRRDTFARSLERWTGGGVDLRWGDAASRWHAFGEVLYGEASVSGGFGTRQIFRSTSGSFALASEEVLTGGSFPVDTGNRWTLGGSWRAAPELHLHGSVEHERHGLAALATDSLRAFSNTALTYRAGIESDLRERVRLPLRIGFDAEFIDFDYDAGTPWSAQFWFADRNFWLEHGEHRLPVSRFVQLGGDDVTTWSPWLEWTVDPGPPIVFRYEGHYYATRAERKPLLYESFFRLGIPITKRLRLDSDTRWALYDDPVLALHEGFAETFAELSYAFTPGIVVGLSYGVDPHVLDVVTNEYGAIGRNEFLYAQGATPTVARDRYLNLGNVLPRAERALEDERRVQLEAIVRF